VKRTRLSEKASADLDAIWLYVAERDGPEAADRLVDRLVETFPLLAAYPAMGRSREDVYPGARMFPVGSYLIFFRKRPKYVEISRVLHGARNIRRL
jgi:toxin ParE1/3/4